jgi:hypothetical protein
MCMCLSLFLVVQRLMATCKREGTTVTGAISAACMRTVQQHIPHEYRQYVYVHSPSLVFTTLILP